MTTAPIQYALAVELAAQGASAPEWVQLFPAGPEIAARDGRRFRLSDPQTVLAAFRQHGAPLPIDVEHATSTRAGEGLDAPAYGWITDLEVRGGAIWGRTEWTDQGRAWIEGKHYRFISPGFAYAKATGEVTRLMHAGLTNTPAFRMTALARQGAGADDPSQQKERETMDPAIAEALGLASNATAADAVIAIGKLREAEANARAAAPDMALYVPKPDHDAALARIEAFETADKARADAAIEAAVDAAISAGKVTPAAKDFHLASARAVGVDAFVAHIEKLPVIAGASGLDGKQPGTATASAAGLSEEELTVARQMGQTAEEFAAAKKQEA